jgi:RNA polymerase sigma-70 factor, ECF subfamily
MEDSPGSDAGSKSDRAPANELELALVARSQRGDVAAFNSLVERYQGLAYALALRMLGDPDAAADVTQDAFFSAYRAIQSFRGASFRAWLLRIVSNGCFDVFRARGRQPSSSLDELLDSETSGDSATPAALIDSSWDPERAILRAEVIAAIQGALLQLPSDQRLAVILSDVQGLPYDEIARIMDSPLGTVKSRIARARGHLRDILARQPELFPRGERQHSSEE